MSDPVAPSIPVHVPQDAGTGTSAASSQPPTDAQVVQALREIREVMDAITLSGPEPESAERLGVVLGNHSALFRALQSIAQEDLTSEMAELLRTYEAASEALAGIQVQLIDEALEGNASLFDAIMNIPAADRSEDMLAFFQLYLKLQEEVNRTATTLGLLGLDAKINALNSLADRIRSEAQSAWKGEVVRGATTIGAGAIQLGGGVYSGGKQLEASGPGAEADRLKGQASGLRQQADDLRSEERQLRGDVGANFQRDLLRGEAANVSEQAAALSQRAVTASNESAALSARSTYAMSAGRAFEMGAANAGSIGAAYDSRDASEKRAGQKENEIEAAVADEFSSNAARYAQQNQDLARTMLQAQEAILQAENQAARAALHVG